MQTPRLPSCTGETSCISSLDQLSICLQLVFIIVIASVTGTKLKQSNGDCYLNLLPGAVCECVPLPLSGLRASSLGLPAVKSVSAAVDARLLPWQAADSTTLAPLIPPAALCL